MKGVFFFSPQFLQGLGDYFRGHLYDHFNEVLVCECMLDRTILYPHFFFVKCRSPRNVIYVVWHKKLFPALCYEPTVRMSN